MIAEFLNRDVVLGVLDQLRNDSSTGADRRGGSQASAEDTRLVADEVSKALDRELAKSSGPRSHSEGRSSDRRGSEAPDLDERAFISSDPIISLVQSALDALYREPKYKDRIVKATRPTGRRSGGAAADPVTDESLATKTRRSSSDRRVFEKFSITDVGWLRSKIAEGIRLFTKRHPFNAEPANAATIANRARLVMVGDWGSGLHRARNVANQMRKEVEAARAEGVEAHVIHLGDVYYSGWDHEYQRRFLPYWPVHEDEADVIGSWCINGNHDMYSGGHGYYKVALSDVRFARWQANAKGPSSFFSLVNDKWKILGLDTSWDDAGLEDPQATWLSDELKGAGNRKTVLLSHHQYASAYEKGARKLIGKVTPVLEQHPVTAWIWGHEHRCMHYSPNAEVKFGRCLGDGGVPVYQWHEVGSPIKTPGTYEHRAFIQHGLEKWALMGFAVLDFVDDRIEVRYIDEDGNEHAKETIA